MNCFDPACPRPFFLSPDEAVALALAPRITLTAPLEPRPAPVAAARTSRGAISLIKAADSRILALEADVRRREGEAGTLQAQLAQAKVSAALGGRGRCRARGRHPARVESSAIHQPSQLH